MNGIRELEQAVAKLSPEGLTAFRAWFDAYDADRWDEEIELDMASGKFDRLAEEALEEYRAGRTKKL